MNASGATMASGSFAAVTAANGACTLADFTVSGYDAPVWDEDEEDYVGGCAAGKFSVQFLTASGTVDANYYWIDNGEIGPGWFNTDKSPIEGGAASVSIAAGQAMWIQGRGLQLVSAGAVNEEDIVFTTRSSGATAIGNGTPVNLTLGQILVEGYADPIYDEDEGETQEGTGVIGGQFSLQFLSSSGSTEATYYFVDDGEHAKGWYTPAWASANSVEFAAGQGVWIQGRGLGFRVPAPELN